MPKTILVIEDDASLLKLIRLKLERAGFRVQGATSGRQALETLDQEKPDLVWLDLLLPDISGLEVLKKIRERESTRNTAVVVVTAYGTGENVRAVSQLAVSEFVVKGEVKLDDIVSRVAQYATPDAP